VPIPRFDERANCTFTVRVPRHHLADEARMEICARRALWGTSIYTDDSDPVAVAIHSGWLRGAWGPEVDLALLDLGPPMVSSPKDKDKDGDGKGAALAATDRPPSTTSPQLIHATIPPTPLEPPPHMDLHITILILPTLECYASSVAYGIKSRAWTTVPHDGMSYSIEKLAWVDERAGRSEERGGEARRKRLRALMTLRGGDAGAGVELGFGGMGKKGVRRGKVKASGAGADAGAGTGGVGEGGDGVGVAAA
jgi:hypothetical protein